MFTEKYEQLGYNLEHLRQHAENVASRDWDVYSTELEQLETPEKNRATAEYIGTLLDCGWSMSLAPNGSFTKVQTRYSTVDSRIPQFLQEHIGLGNLGSTTNPSGVVSYRWNVGAKGDVSKLLDSYWEYFQQRKPQAKIMREYLDGSISGPKAQEAMKAANNAIYLGDFELNTIRLAAFVDYKEAGFHYYPQPTSFENRNTPQYAFWYRFGTEIKPIIDTLMLAFSEAKRHEIEFTVNEGTDFREHFVLYHNYAYPMLKMIEPHVVFKRRQVALAIDYLESFAAFNLGLDNEIGYTQGGNLEVADEYKRIRERRHSIRVQYLKLAGDSIVNTNFDDFAPNLED